MNEEYPSYDTLKLWKREFKFNRTSLEGGPEKISVKTHRISCGRKIEQLVLGVDG